MHLSRRSFLASVPGALAAQPGRIDRRAVVTRHNPTLTAIDPRSPLSVGNGELAFTVDPTGLQTFSHLYNDHMPLCTQSQWGWHTIPNPKRQTESDFRMTDYDTFGRPVPYPTSSTGQKELYDWLRENPHRLHLGRIGFAISDSPSITHIRQTLDLWTGILHSEFECNGTPIVVETCCHPALDMLAVSVRGHLPVRFEFPYGTGDMTAADWKHPDRHITTERIAGNTRWDFARKLDLDTYHCSVFWQTQAAMKRESAHQYTLSPTGPKLEFVCAFSRATPRADLPAAADTFSASRSHWAEFWNSGAALDLSGASDPKARELERRIVLSQYLAAIQCAGSLPPQETGLTCNSWYGKFHLEMHYWHAAHFAAWGRAPLLERSLGWYSRILPSAKDWAKRQGYPGARWPKMTGPGGHDSPSPIGPLLIWQQPHPIHMAEWVYRASPTSATLAKYRDLVFGSADFMAGFAHYDQKGSRYVLGPPVIPAQENHPPRETWNPTFELEYWADALDTAQKWRARLGMPRNPQWDTIRRGLAPLPVKDGVYLAHENCPQTFTERNRDHPSMLYALGVLPGRKVDRETMRRTLKKVFAEWKWEDTWGWDFPAVAMTAASLGEPALAIDALMMQTPKNTWLPNGHNWQRANLPLYLPGNGGLLLAVAHMARNDAFPKSWRVSTEGLLASPLY